MAILLLADHDNATLSEHSAKALTAARQIGADVDILVAGVDTLGVASAAAQLQGVRRVLRAEGPALQHHLAEPLSALLLSLSGDYDTFIAAATSTGKAVMPRLAAHLDTMQVSEVISVLAPDCFLRPIYAGNAQQTVQTLDIKRVLTIRTSAFAAAATGGTAEILTITVPDLPNPSAFLGNSVSKSERAELGTARIVVSGGRALGSQADFDKIILPVADALGAAVGASRAAVDAGYAPNDWQVGQTGKVVAPELYIAVGISGAIQHLAGMKDSKIIVAINKDEDAPIFQVADYRLVGDLFDLMPQLQQQLERK